MVNFDPTVGSEIKKTGPALIIQNDIANRYSPITIVAAITSQIGEKIYPTEVLIESGQSDLGKRCVVLLNQVRAIDKRRLVKKLGFFDLVTMEKVNQALGISLGLTEL